MQLPQVTETWLDRAIGWASPRLAVERRRARLILAMSGAYLGARRDRRATSEWVTRAGSADADLIPDLPSLRERSRDLEMNEPLAGGAINTVVTEAVGTGLYPRARIDREFLRLSDEEADAWQDAAEREWWLWADSQECDLTRTQRMIEMQDLALRSVLTSGDAFVIKRFLERPGSPYGLKLQFVEADRVENPQRRDVTDLEGGRQIVAGVETDEHGAPVAYHVLRRHPGDLYGRGAVREPQRIVAFTPQGERLVLHLFGRRRPGQNRGVPYLAPVIEQLKQLGRYTEAELMAAVVSSLFTVFVKTAGGGGIGPVQPTSETGGKKSDKDLKLASGMVVDLMPGEAIEIADPKRPNAAFDPFVTAVYRQVGVRLELPFEVLIKHFSSSYSASRAALLQAWKFLRRERNWLADSLCQPVYGWLITEAVIRGRLRAPGFMENPLVRAAYLGTEWIGPPAGTIDPESEINAAEKRIDIGVSSIDRETAEMMGGEFDVTHRQRVKEKRKRVADGLEPAEGAASAAPVQERRSAASREREMAMGGQA